LVFQEFSAADFKGCGVLFLREAVDLIGTDDMLSKMDC